MNPAKQPNDLSLGFEGGGGVESAFTKAAYFEPPGGVEIKEAHAAVERVRHCRGAASDHVHGDEDLAGLGSFAGADDAAHLEDVHHAGGAAVA